MENIPKYRYKNIPSQQTLTMNDLSLLRSYTTFKTLNDYADFFIRLRSLQPSNKTLIVGRLNSFLKEGLLIEEKEFISNIFQQFPPQQDNTSKIETVAIQTADRPQELEKLLTSLIANLNVYDRLPEILISDDSVIDDFKKNKKTIENIEKQYSGRIIHIDRVTRQKKADDIARKLGIDPAISRFAFCPDTTGINQCGAGRNYLLASSAGKKILMLDDDVIIKTHKPIDDTDKLLISSSLQNYIHYFNTHEEAVKYYPEVELDYIKQHEKWLGRRVKDAISEFGSSRITFDRIPGGVSNKLFEVAENISSLDPKILFTHTGSVGDSWTRYHSNLDASQRNPHDLFGISPGDFKKNMETPFVSRIDQMHMLYYGPACVSLNMGVDATELLPPFPPLFRGQDNLFGLITDYTNPIHFSMRIPFAVEHKRASPRKRETIPFVSFLSIGFITRIIFELCKSSESLDLDTHTKIISLGERLIEFSKLPSEEIESIIRSEISKRIQIVCTFAASMRAHYQEDAPQWWIDSIDELIKFPMKHSSRILSMSLYSDYPNLDPNRWVKDLGTLLKEWPYIYNLSNKS